MRDRDHDEIVTILEKVTALTASERDSLLEAIGRRMDVAEAAIEKDLSATWSHELVLARDESLDEAGKKFQEILDAEHCPCRKQMALDLQVWRLTLE